MVSELSRFYKSADIGLAGYSGFIGHALAQKLYSLKEKGGLGYTPVLTCSCCETFHDIIYPINTLIYCSMPSPKFFPWWEKNHSKVKNIIYLHTSAINSRYALAKAEEVKAIKESGVDLYLYTLPSIYGPGQRRGMLIPNLIMNSLDGKVTEVDQCFRNYLHIDELTERLLIDYYHNKKEVSYGGEVKLSFDIACIICNKLNGTWKIRNKDYDIINGQSTLIPFHLGLLETITWYQR